MPAIRFDKIRIALRVGALDPNDVEMNVRVADGPIPPAFGGFHIFIVERWAQEILSARMLPLVGDFPAENRKLISRSEMDFRDGNLPAPGPGEHTLTIRPIVVISAAGEGPLENCRTRGACRHPMGGTTQEQDER